MVPSGLQPSPFDSVIPSSTVVMVPSGSRRYSAPAPGLTSLATVPAQNRPAGSHAPSLKRTSSGMSGGRHGPASLPPPESASRKPSAAASTYPPEPRWAAAPIGIGCSSADSSSTTSSPWPGVYRCSRPALMSTQVRHDPLGSQTGRSPSSARAGTTTSHGGGWAGSHGGACGGAGSGRSVWSLMSACLWLRPLICASLGFSLSSPPSGVRPHQVPLEDEVADDGGRQTAAARSRSGRWHGFSYGTGTPRPTAPGRDCPRPS